MQPAIACASCGGIVAVPMPNLSFRPSVNAPGASAAFPVDHEKPLYEITSNVG